MRKFITSLGKYVAGTKADVRAMGNTLCQPVSSRTMITMMVFAAVMATVMCFSPVFASTTTDLFGRLNTAFTTLYNDANAIVGIVASLALVIAIIGVFVASMFGAKATAMMTSGLKLVVMFFIFWQLIPVILKTITTVFGDGSAIIPGSP